VLGGIVKPLRPILVTGVLLAGGVGLVIAGVWRSVTPRHTPVSCEGDSLLDYPSPGCPQTVGCGTPSAERR